MKIRIVQVGIATLIASAGCRLDPNAVLGNAPQSTDPPEIYNSVCEQRTLSTVKEVDDKDCVTPNDKSNVLASIDGTADYSEVKVTLQSRYTNGQKFKLVRLQYRSVSLGQVIELACAEPVIKDDHGEEVEIACRLPKSVVQSINGVEKFVLYGIDLKNEGCAATAVYRPSPLDNSCHSPTGDKASDDEIYYRHNRTPQLFVRNATGPGEKLADTTSGDER